MSKFIGRKKELSLLEGLLLKKTSSLAVVYGRRRVGKSRLITEFSKKHTFISFSGIFPEEETNNQDQLNEFSRKFKEQFKRDIGVLTRIFHQTIKFNFFLMNFENFKVRQQFCFNF